MITTQLVALDIIRGAGGNPVPPAPVAPGGGSKHRRPRKIIKLRNGQTFEVENEDEMRDIVQRIIEERQEQLQAPVKKAKVSRKIRQRAPKSTIINELSSFDQWHELYESLSHIQLAVITEQILLGLIRNTVLAEMQDEEETEILLWLM